MTCARPPDTSHDHLRLGLMGAGLAMWRTREQPDDFPEARDRLVTFCRTQLLPHLDDDDSWLLEARRCAEGRLLAEAMQAEARTMRAAVYELSVAPAACEAMAHTRVLHTFLAAHDHHESLLRTVASAA